MEKQEDGGMDRALASVCKDIVYDKLNLGTEEGLDDFYQWYLESYHDYREQISRQADAPDLVMHERLGRDAFRSSLDRIFGGNENDRLFEVNMDTVNPDYSQNRAVLIILRLVFRSPLFEKLQADFLRQILSQD